MATNPPGEAPNSHTVKTLEERIALGDADAMKRYVADAFEHHLEDRDELHRRRMILGRSVPEITTPIECIALISAALDDQEGWNLMINTLEGEGDPGLGYLAWRMLLYHSKEEQHAERWMHAVEHSARLGHFSSRRRVLLRELKSSGFLSSFETRRRLFDLERERQRHEEADPTSRLLADYNQGPSTLASQMRRLFSIG